MPRAVRDHAGRGVTKNYEYPAGNIQMVGKSNAEAMRGEQPQLTCYRNRVGAVLGWWFAFTRDLRRERTFTIDDMPLEAGPYGGLSKSTLSGKSVP